MHPTERIARIDAAISSLADLRRSGATQRDVTRLTAEGRLVRVVPGWYAAGDAWANWYAEERHLAAVLAVHRGAAEAPVFTHHSAAVLLGLPLWGLRSEKVHLVTGSRFGSWSSGSVTHHLIALADSDVTQVAGIRCTTHDRTLFDLSAYSDEFQLVGAADAVLRRSALRGRAFDGDRADAWREGMLERAAAGAGRRGIRLLRRVTGFADPRAESVLESVDRVHFDRLGFAVRLQVPVPAPHGGEDYRCDFAIDEAGVFGEADGEAKYADPAQLRGRTPAEAVVRERKRDNWITGTTGRRVIHWGARESASTEAFAAMLRSYHVTVPNPAGTGLLRAAAA